MERQLTPVLLPGEFHGQKSFMGYSPWGHKESHMTEQLTLLLQLTHIHFFWGGMVRNTLPPPQRCTLLITSPILPLLGGMGGQDTFQNWYQQKTPIHGKLKLTLMSSGLY